MTYLSFSYLRQFILKGNCFVHFYFLPLSFSLLCGRRQLPLGPFQPLHLLKKQFLHILHILLHMFTHRHRCTQFACATLYFLTFLRGQQHHVSMIDLVSEAEIIYSEFSVRGYWVSSCWKHTHMCYCMASRDTMPGLHLAEHKWVKRNYNKEQSSLLTPPGAYRLLQSAPALFTPLGVLSTSQTRLPL